MLVHFDISQAHGRELYKMENKERELTMKAEKAEDGGSCEAESRSVARDGRAVSVRETAALLNILTLSLLNILILSLLNILICFFRNSCSPEHFDFVPPEHFDLFFYKQLLS